MKATDPGAVAIVGISPDRPGRGEPSSIRLTLYLHYLRHEPIVNVTIPHRQAMKLMADLAKAIEVTAP